MMPESTNPPNESSRLLSEFAFPGQPTRRMGRRDGRRMRWRNRRHDERWNARELLLYSTDDLRRLYQEDDSDLIRLRNGIVWRDRLVTEIRRRDRRERRGYRLMLFMSLVAAVASVISAIEGSQWATLPLRLISHVSTCR